MTTEATHLLILMLKAFAGGIVFALAIKVLIKTFNEKYMFKGKDQSGIPFCVPEYPPKPIIEEHCDIMVPIVHANAYKVKVNTEEAKDDKQPGDR